MEIGEGIGLTKTQFRVFFQALKERRRHNWVVVAMEHKIARIIYEMRTKNETDKENDCTTLKEVRLERLLKSVKNAFQVQLVVRRPIVVDTENGLIYKT